MGHEGHEHDHEHHHDEPAREEPSQEAPVAESTARFGHDASGVTSILHVDPVAGAAGDMLIAALLDLEVPESALRASIDTLGLAGFRLEIARREKHAIAARSFDVVVDEAKQPPRDYATIEALLSRASLPPRVRTLAKLAFLRLGEAEAKIHRQPLARVHFHEVGGVDAIVDVVGACAGLAWLEERAGGVGALGFSMGALPVGGGFARGAHGSIPVPAPAALELMIGLPTRDSGISMELVTPTGAALLRAWSEALPIVGARGLGAWPSFSPRAVGYGAGTRDLADRPNVVRLVLGDATTAADAPTSSRDPGAYVVLESNIDDATGEVAATTIEALLREGARDAWAQPITMKKGRPAITLAVLVDAHRAEEFARLLLAHSGSLGLRRGEVSRFERPRRFLDVETKYGCVRVKIADGDDLPRVVHPELEECKRLAAAAGVPVREVIRAAIVAVG